MHLPYALKKKFCSGMRFIPVAGAELSL